MELESFNFPGNSSGSCNESFLPLKRSNHGVVLKSLNIVVINQNES